MARRTPPRLKDTKRARLLRERASQTPNPPEGTVGVEQLCEGGDNIFAELGFPHPERELVKAMLITHIWRIIEERDLTQAEAAGILGITQQEVSAMKKNRLSNFSVDRLIEFVVALRHDLEIAIGPSDGDRGRVSVIRSPVSRPGFLPKLRSLFVRKPSKPN